MAIECDNIITNAIIAPACGTSSRFDGFVIRAVRRAPEACARRVHVMVEALSVLRNS